MLEFQEQRSLLEVACICPFSSILWHLETFLNGAILYRGLSQIDGVSPIVAIATGLERGSKNAKTGDMVQSYILREDISPTDAIKADADVAICGQCPHKGSGGGKDRTCYVNVAQGPLAVWRAYKRDVYPRIENISALGEKRVVRLGSYGDPAAVPVSIWEALTRDCVAHTGYTHQWRERPELKSLCMASVDSITEAEEARSQGWRTFRVALPCDNPRESYEAICPASAEAGKKLACTECRACDGLKSNRRGSVVIQAHGGFGVMNAIARKAA